MSGVGPKGRDESVVFHEQMDKNRERRGERKKATAGGNRGDSPNKSEMASSFY